MLVKACGSVVLEFIGEPIKGLSNDQTFPATDKMRFSFKNSPVAELKETGKVLTAVKVSRATSRLDDVKTFFSEDLGFQMITNQTSSDGSELAVFMLDHTSLKRV